jgi:archaellum component FlaC
MIYYTNIHGLYYNSQFDLDKVKDEINRIRNLQEELKLYLTQITQSYKSVQPQHNTITSLNDRMPNNVKITNKVEESKLEIKDVDSNFSTSGQTITIPFNEEIPSNLKGGVEQLEKILNEISNINNSFLLKYGAYDNVNNQITFKKNSTSNDMKTKITISFGINLANDGNSIKILESYFSSVHN